MSRDAGKKRMLLTSWWTSLLPSYDFHLFDSLAPFDPNGLLIAGTIVGAITALVSVFRPKSSPITAPIYAASEGMVLGGIWAVF
jgi:uncharacterized YccA/Bax inhibitor family protein